jgi:HAE1 family hydrophobic/amphiphilic exporter-1
VKHFIEFSVNRAITIFMSAIIVIVFGIVSITNLTTDLFPNVNIPYAVVFTTYPGASPFEVEETITNPLEDALATTTNVKSLESISSENYSIIILEFNESANMDSAVIEMRENLSFVSSDFPDMVSEPRIIKLNPNMMPIMQVSITKENTDQKDLTEIVKQEVLPLIERIPGVASVDVSGAYESDIQVLLDDNAITQINNQLNDMYNFFGIAEDDMIFVDKELVSNILQAQNFEFPIGYTEVEGINYLVRVGDEFKNLEEIQNLKIFNFPGISGVVDPIVFTLDDIADVSFVDANEKEYSKVNGEDAITFYIQKSSEFATTDVTHEIQKVLDEAANTKEGLQFTILFNQGDYIDQSIGNVTTNLIYGAILAVVVLLLFLKSLRATGIVALSIPISLMFAIVMIYFSGITLNIVSMGGLALGIGMLVDNSIVVIENIYRLRSEGASKKEAAMEGAKQVSGAITASTITTISVFVPVMFIEGFIKEIFLQMALTIIFSLTASLVISLTLVPAISAKVMEKKKSKADEESRFKIIYQDALMLAMRFKALVLLIVLGLFGLSIGLALNKGFIYFPESDEGQISISVTNPIERPLTYQEFVTVLDDLSNEIAQMEDVETVGASLGSMQGLFFGMSSVDSATINVLLKDDRSITTKEAESEIAILLIEQFTTIEFDITGSQQQTDVLTGSGMQIEVRGYDLDILKEEAVQIASLIENVDGVETVDNGLGRPSDEIKITVDKDKASRYGLTTAQVMQKVSEIIRDVAATTSIVIGSDIYDLYVVEQADLVELNYTLSDYENLIIGQNFLNPIELVKLKDVATVEFIEGFQSISHNNGVRSVTIDVQYEADANITKTANNIENILQTYAMPDGYDYLVHGENEEVMNAMRTLLLAVALGVLLIYMVMASQFQSLTYPFIIMFTIPLAFTGGFFMLWLAGMPVSVVSAIGLIVLTGIVVNNGIVLVDYINQLREQKMDLIAAIAEAGKTRLRPIIMTALTTILALTTMAIGLGKGSEILQPMAVTTIGGLLYATVLTLIVVPIMYYLTTKYSKWILTGLIITLIIASTIATTLLFGYWWLILIGFLLLTFTLYISIKSSEV